MKIGDPLDRSTDHGPQNHKAHLDKLVEYCEIGVKEGATLICGGRQVDRPGETHDLQADSDIMFRCFAACNIRAIDLINMFSFGRGRKSFSLK